jgi:acyl-CoA thioester hydrolase
VSEPTSTWSAPVRYVECDQQGIVFNGHYLTWADEAATAWWAAVGLPYADLATDGEALVKSSSLVWTSSARWGDVVDVEARLASLGRTSLALQLDVRVGERSCCVVTTTYVFVVGGAATPWPDRVRALLAG